MSQTTYDNILGSISSTPHITASQASNKNTNSNSDPTSIHGQEIDINTIIPPKADSSIPPKNLFDINGFIEDVNTKAENRNKERALNTIMINSYAVAHDCIRESFFRIMNYPAKNYKDVYVPINLKATLGNAIHDFIQNYSSVFTETETSVKVPSIRVSCRMDALINDDVIVEIKSCNFKDYETILKTQKPRDPDFLQVTLYKYLLENHLKEAQQQQNLRTPPPKLDKYNIRYFQFIYVANDILSADAPTVSEALKDVSRVKKALNSKYNQFYFINSVTIDLTTFDITPHYNWIVNKINRLNGYLNSNKIPPIDDPYMSSNCFFCIYKDICKQYK